MSPSELVSYLDFGLGVGLTAAVFGLRRVWRWLAPSIYRDFGLNRPRDTLIATERSETVTVASDYRATIRTTSTCLFHRRPTGRELVQYYSQTDDLSKEDIFEFDGLKVTSTRRVNAKATAMYLAPVREVGLYEPFSYSTKLVTDPVYGPDSFFSAFDVDRHTGRLTIAVETERPISEVYIRRLPQLLTAIFIRSHGLDDRLLYEIFLRAFPRTIWHPPPKARGRSGRGIEWEIPEPPLWSRYVVFCVYEGLEERARAARLARNLTFWERVYCRLLRWLS